MISNCKRDLNIPAPKKGRILVIGGGFAGISLIKQMRKSSYQLVLLDTNNYHTFQPLLYQVATGGLEPESITFPFRKIFRKDKNVYFRMSEVSHIDPDQKKVDTNIGCISYDYLVIAAGTQTNFFGNKEMEQNTLGMKTVPEAKYIRNQIFTELEKANMETDPVVRSRSLNFVIVGGGATGVELAGALAEFKNYLLAGDYPEIDPAEMEIHLIEGGENLLGGMSQQSSDSALRYLKKMGVKIHREERVIHYEEGVVETHTGKQIGSHTVLWATGVKAIQFDGLGEKSQGPGKRLRVNEYNLVEGFEDIYALGDIAYMETEAYPEGHPQVAQVAIQQGKHMAKNFKSFARGRDEVLPFEYFDKGSMATIGRRKAVVDLPNLFMNGALAWFVWLFIHILFLMGFRNRLIVLINWMWQYFAYDKGARVILAPKEKEVESAQETDSSAEHESRSPEMVV